MNRIILIICLFFFSLITYSQEEKKMSLSDVIKIAQEQSLSAKKVKNTWENSYWRFYSYKKMFLPSINYNGTIPSLNFDFVPSPQGDSYLRRNSMQFISSISMSQKLRLTGGEVFVSSDLNRLDDFTADNSSTSYFSEPISIGFSQPILKFNSYKWMKKIEPLYFEQAQKEIIENSENVSIEAVNYFFDVIRNEATYKMELLNKQNSDTLFKISKGRYELGKIAESELLQIELTLLNAEKSLAQSDINLYVSKQRLKTFLSLSKDLKILLDVQTNIPNLQLEIDTVILYAKRNRSEFVNFEKILLESERELERAKRQNSFSADLYVAYGLTNTAYDVSNAYKDPLSKQRVTMGVQVPIYNWGLSKSRVKQQKANSELIENEIKQQKEYFEESLYIKATQFNLMYQQVVISEKAMVVARKRYEVAKQRYLIGKSDILTFNTSLNERNQAIRSYYATLHKYWTEFYEIRKLTHYDFINNQSIDVATEL